MSKALRYTAAMRAGSEGRSAAKAAARAIAVAVPVALAMVLAGACGGGSRDAASDGAASSDGAPRHASTPSGVPDAASAGETPRAIVLITVDTLRADRVGAYGWRAARTPAIDTLAARGLRMDRAYAPAPITLVSHASLLTGLNPPRHGARHNGLRLPAGVPTLAERLRARGFATGAFIAAFPLDRRFGLDRGFDTYGDTLPRGADGRPRNERPGAAVVDEALAWLAARDAKQPLFLWVHLFEPHAPYEPDAATVGRSASERYDAEIARADAQIARLVSALQPRAASTLFIVTADHGEAFGEHGEIGHSLFVYDTTLRVPLVMAGLGVTGDGAAAAANGGSGGTAGRLETAGSAEPGSEAGRVRARSGAAPEAAGMRGRVILEPVSLIDIVPTVLDLLRLGDAAGTRTGAGAGADAASTRGDADASAGQSARDTGGALDGVSLAPLLAGRGTIAPRALYAESFAPLLDFGWSPLRALRRGAEKYIAAPKPELYDVTRDPGESRNLLPERAAAADALAAQIEAISPADIRPPRMASSVAGAENVAGTAPGSTASGSAAPGDGAARARGAQVAAGAAAPTVTDREAEARLRSLGYLASSSPSPAPPSAPTPPSVPAASARPAASASGATGKAGASAAARGAAGTAMSGTRALATRIDPKDRVAFAARIAEITSGELQGPALRRALAQLVKEDPRNGQMQLRLGVLLQESGDCRGALPRYRAAIAASVPSADPHLGLAECLAAAGDGEAARRALVEADRVEPGNPIVSANLGMLALEAGRTPEAITRLRAALDRAPDLHAVRFALARAYGRAGQRADAAREARDLLARLPPEAPQRAEVERLLAAVQ